MRISAFSTLLIAMALGGCSLAPTYERPVAPVADSWSGQAHQRGSAVNEMVWQTFIVDPDLRRLVTTALDNNRSLRQTLLDIEQARAQYRIQRADRVPGLNAGASGNRQRVPADLSNNGRSGVVSSYQVGLSLPEYELDLFGRVKSLSDAALQEYLATEEAARAAQIALIAEVSQAYLIHDGALRRLDLTQQTLASREYSFALISQRRSAGTATALDYQEALGLVEQSRAEEESNQRQKQQAFNALVLLLGTADAAKSIPQGVRKEPMLVQDIAPGTPSALIERRPDILAAEHRLQARNADIGAARAAFFPRISLTGSFGTSSAQMSGLFDGGSRSWSFVPNLSLPLFDAGRNSAGLSLAEARKDSAVAAYEGTIQTAFREVADALAATDTLRREEAARRALADTSSESLKLAKARYEGGVDSHLRYLDAQRSSFVNETLFIEASTQRQIALVDLFRSLGGGWPSARHQAEQASR
ncbi:MULTISPECIES: efflux transporter outer membrane subunit [Pseudomonas]|uniref:Efflux transporter outer membrane subunit n=2 Tax=Pseudomonas chlororaphis TaxID=587753 RepID=A0AAQ1FIP9_9PSED|nr:MULTISPECIES: efflux transporter outer membrane subunit [Pseudomonas]AUG41182.1 multidrug transporter [Pseudomonas chlororaphis]AZC76044.1 Multidrug efflux system, outer membrane factor lipoprotein OprJ [Pseudomonas chlororaphis subsp. piscium]AZD22354.1 Multidrug efflux system, outer membrane factor lipoprotein OprJ [Pseudomonas chlororaphis subsp. aurantiaca]AZD48568.1 Multidrug efflux system, outer membrane factor lipoprotein OprJ [Pseudomonas chlororaphis subsp. aurantiaca]AZD54889.1 Mu